MWFARRNLLHEPTQLILTIFSIGLSVMLVIVLVGVLAGVRRQAGDYLAHAPGSIIVAATGSDNFLVVAVPLLPETAAAVRADPGVASVVPLLSQMVVMQLHDRREATFLIGYDPTIGGGPRQITSGAAPARDNEIVLGRVLAERHHVSVGDTILVLGRSLTISGLANDASPLMTSFAFTWKSTLEGLLFTPGLTSVLLVTPRDGLSSEALRDQLSGITGTSVFLKEQVIANDVALFTASFQPVIRLMAGIALLAGTLVVGLLIYTATLQRRREYGVLKAVGIRNPVLYRVIGAQALIAALIGATTGLALSVLIARLITAFRPEFLIPLTWAGVLIATGAGVIMALLASLAPARVIAQLAPADVFRR
jgi:putative ABC transport system permease protein